MNRIERELQNYLPDMYQPAHGQLSQRTVTPEMLAAYREYQQQLRLLQDLQHQQRNEQINGLVKLLVIGSACLGGVLLCLAIFAGATRPPESKPTVVNPDCWMFCGGRAQ